MRLPPGADLPDDLDQIADTLPIVQSNYRELRSLIGLLPTPIGPAIPGSSITPLADQQAGGQDMGSPVANTLQGDAPGTQAGWDQALASQAIYDAFNNLGIGEGGGFGSSVIRYLLSGIYNSDWMMTPREPGNNIGADNPLPFWPAGLTGSGITALDVLGSSVGGGGVLPNDSRAIKFTMAAGAAEDEFYLEQIIPINSSVEQRFGYSLSCAFLTGAATSDGEMFLSTQFLEEDGTPIGSIAESNVTTAVKGAWTLFSFGHRASSSSATPANAARLRIRIGFRRATAAVGATDEVYLIDAVRYVHGSVSLNDIDAPGTYDFGGVSQASGLLTMLANNAGTGGGSQSKLELDGSGSNPIARIFGSLELKSSLALEGDVTSTVTGTQNNLSLAATTAVLRWNGASVATFTGLTGGADGRVLVIRNVTANDLTLMHENVGSTAANRISCPAGLSRIVPPLGTAILIYDATFGRWMLGPGDFGIAPVVRVYGVAGSPHTYSKPAGLHHVVVEGVGGGGGGGGTGATGGSTRACGSGGGGGGFTREVIPAGALGASVTVTVGGGGTGGVGAATGAAGGNSTFGAFCGGNGGGGGSGGPATSGDTTGTGGAGGTASGGDINATGSDGGRGIVRGGIPLPIGNGGASHLGGSAPCPSSSSNGASGYPYGGGGAGAQAGTGQGALNGGSGADGVVVVTEHYTP